jgi:hypothetical protein
MLIMEENTYNRLVAVQGLGSITVHNELNQQLIGRLDNRGGSND